jgi:hypothetical protein
VVSFLDPGTYELVIPKEGPGGSGEQLFFLKNDPDEPRNLARDAGYARIRGEMPDRLLRSLIPADCPPTRKSLYGLGVFQPVARPAKDGMLR